MSENSSTESMTVVEAKTEFKNGRITINDASSVEPSLNGFKATFLCSDGHFIVSEQVVETEVEDKAT